MLANKAVVVPVGLAAAQATAVARRLAAEGAAIVLVTGEDDVEAGRVAADLAPARTAVFVLTSQEAPDLDALVELLAELFP
ncbi:MAG: hypothetical protein M3314_14230 [Actinomycetota bacterium]|nr:hypothetical protein [Actinomycetota bacterium]